MGHAWIKRWLKTAGLSERVKWSELANSEEDYDGDDDDDGDGSVLKSGIGYEKDKNEVGEKSLFYITTY